jgi:hypothetical protein
MHTPWAREGSRYSKLMDSTPACFFTFVCGRRFGYAGALRLGGGSVR